MDGIDAFNAVLEELLSSKETVGQLRHDANGLREEIRVLKLKENARVDMENHAQVQAMRNGEASKKLRELGINLWKAVDQHVKVQDAHPELRAAMKASENEFDDIPF